MDKKKIIKELNSDGYTIIKQYFSKIELNEIKESLLETLNYIYPSNETDLSKKYYEVKKFNSKLKGNWYDIAPFNLSLLTLLHKKDLINIAKSYFNTKVLFSGRPCIHAHDDSNQHILDAHQETSQFAVDNLVFWSPIDDTNEENGGLSVYLDSHNKGYFDHKLEHPNGKKVWTKDYTHIPEDITSKYKKINLNVKAGSAVLMKSSMIHCGYPTKKRGHLRITLTERFNPLRKLPFLKNPEAPLKIPYIGIDYNSIPD